MNKNLVIGAAILGVAIVATLFIDKTVSRETTAASVSSATPDFSIRDTNGKTFKLSSHKGKVVYINFFATWCGPCRQEFPELVKLNEKYAGKDFVMVSISLDNDRTIKEVKPFAERYKAKHQVLLGDGAFEAAEKYKVEGIPANFLIGKDGKIKNSWVGFMGKDDVKKWETAINNALK